MNMTDLDPISIEKIAKELSQSADQHQWKAAIRYYKMLDSFS